MHKVGVPFRFPIKLFYVSAMLIAVLVVVVGCTSSTSEPVGTAAPTEAAEPTPTEAPTPTLAPTETPGPTATPRPTPTPVPTATPEPTATPRPTPVPTLTPIPNSRPIITNPGNKSYERGESITKFNITVADTEDTPLVTLSGLPSDLTYESGQVSGTVALDAATKDYEVTITAADGVNTAVSATFTITVINTAPMITNPGNKSYYQGESITAFGVMVTDAEDTPTVTVSNLPPGLSYVSGQVSGKIDSDATAEDYMVTISADDGVNPVESTMFLVRVRP